MLRFQKTGEHRPDGNIYIYIYTDDTGLMAKALYPQRRVRGRIRDTHTQSLQ